MIANCGMKRVIFEEEYPDPLAVGILTTAGVQLLKWDPAKKLAVPLKDPNSFEQAQDELRRRHRAGTLVPAPKPGQLPMATDRLPTMPAPRGGKKTAAAQEEEVPEDVGDASDDASLAHKAGIRDVTSDPRRQEMLRGMAKAKAEQRRKQREDQEKGR
jgi:hypothetical protein